MSGTAIARGLLIAQGAPLTNLVPAASIFVGVIPQNTAPPCIGITSVVATEFRTVDGNRARSALVTESVQVTVLAASLVSSRAIMKQVRRACRDFVGTVVTTGETFSGVTCSLGPKGPDFANDAGLAMQSQDLRITFNESNV